MFSALAYLLQTFSMHLCKPAKDLFPQFEELQTVIDQISSLSYKPHVDYICKTNLSHPYMCIIKA